MMNKQSQENNIKGAAEGFSNSLLYANGLETVLKDLSKPINLRPARGMTRGELESYLGKAADILRSSSDDSSLRGYIFALLFYKRINDCFEEEVNKQMTTLTKAGVPEEQARALAIDPQNHHFVVP